MTVVMLHSDILPGHSCDGELIPLKESSTYVQVVLCSSCGAEFSFEPDFDWVTDAKPNLTPSFRTKTRGEKSQSGLSLVRPG